MKTIINKTKTYALTFILVISFILQIPSVSAKYSNTVGGTVWEILFDDIALSDIFYITGPGYSDNLHGFDEKDEDGTIKDPTSVPMTDENGNVLTDSNGNIIYADDFYELTEAVNISFPAYNASDTPMLICFDIAMCMNMSVSGSWSTNTITIEGTKNEVSGTVTGSFSQDYSGEPSDISSGLTVTKSEQVQYEGADAWFLVQLASGDYYLYNAYLNTYTIITDNDANNNSGETNCFILNPGESATYSISVSGAGEIAELDKIYSSINLVAVECDETGKPTT